ncbi:MULTISPECIES: protein sorting system archaetidylserine decarboxylase [Haloferax]|uniref:Putative archaetidylserine decarboxylase proenzyme n=1 Tax=Haloferax marinum TaxID=2666143 RepID=A0A6A8G7V3_9EURY|nr:MULTISPECIES: protein sorting system archaetidylserine decarboxylase [Haloferax]KAB1197572.1 phosphatidylserine decarboxylase [Haloferax sp. CBA1150]MRW96622.1 phosphatidylserine decarboxylase [Haloferax marinum]
MKFAPGYRRFAVPAFLGAAVAAFVFPPIGAVLLGFGVFVLWFFRDPERAPPDEPGVISPADGHVSVIRAEDGRVRVGVFMNVTDVHVNRAPVSGRVRTVTHRPGAHKPAFSKDSDNNERVDIVVESDDGEYEVSQIAGAFARRIHPYVATGDHLERGDKIGHIDFGSRADVLLPEEFSSEDVIVEKGESVRAGETVLAKR